MYFRNSLSREMYFRNTLFREMYFRNTLLREMYFWNTLFREMYFRSTLLREMYFRRKKHSPQHQKSFRDTRKFCGVEGFLLCGLVHLLCWRVCITISCLLDRRWADLYILVLTGQDGFDLERAREGLCQMEATVAEIEDLLDNHIIEWVCSNLNIEDQGSPLNRLSSECAVFVLRDKMYLKVHKIFDITSSRECAGEFLPTLFA